MVVVVAAGARRFYREFIGQDSIVSLLAGATLLWRTPPLQATLTKLSFVAPSHLHLHSFRIDALLLCLHWLALACIGLHWLALAFNLCPHL